jgi:hypothetical protein
VLYTFVSLLSAKPYKLLEVSIMWKQSGNMVKGKALEQTGPRRQAASEHKFQDRERFRRNLVFRNSHGHFQHVGRNINSSPGEKDTFTALRARLFHVVLSQLDNSTNSAPLFSS